MSKRAVESLGGMPWQEFELLVGEAFRLQGYEAVDGSGGETDRGVDLMLRKDGETYLLQCKQWKASKVSVSVVRELYGSMTATGAAGGFVVTSGQFTEEAVQFAQGHHVKLVDGPKLFELMQQAKVPESVRKELSALAAKPETDIDYTDLPTTIGNAWSGAERGKFYRPLKQQLTVRIDADVLEWLKEQGSGYQSRLNEILP